METVAERKKRVTRIVRLLRKFYPDVRLALEFATPLDLLVALILAAQCTDNRVNQVTATVHLTKAGRPACCSLLSPSSAATLYASASLAAAIAA